MSLTKFILKTPSAFLPILMSAGAFSLVFFYLVLNGIPSVPAEDEGTGAHIFQILIAGQIPIILYFAIKYIVSNTKHAWKVLILQLIAGIIPFILLYILEH